MRTKLSLTQVSLSDGKAKAISPLQLTKTSKKVRTRQLKSQRQRSQSLHKEDVLISLKALSKGPDGHMKAQVYIELH